MSEKITVPTLGESVTEATVSKWLKSQGEKVVADEPIVEFCLLYTSDAADES